MLNVNVIDDFVGMSMKEETHSRKSTKGQTRIYKTYTYN
jgi:hypothetical protein